MYEPLTFPPDIESGVRFVEETPPENIIGETVSKLKGGKSPVDMVRSAALAVIRSTELPSNHHGGAVHPVAGLHGCLHTAMRLQGEEATLPIVQHVAVCNHHIHSPQMGPYIMPKLEPRDGSMDQAFEVFKDSESSVVHMGEHGDTPGQQGKKQLEKAIRAFVNSIENRRPVAAEQCLLWLLQRQQPGEVLDHMLPICVLRNHLDDHNFLYPVLSAIALEDIGWEWATVLLRPAVRYHARYPSDLTEFGFIDTAPVIEQAMQEYHLEDRRFKVDTNASETEAVADLASRISTSPKFINHIGIMAKALVNGLSLQGAGEALSIAASTLFINSEYGNPMDSHMHTGAHTRRFLIQLPGVSQRSRVMALLSGITGPECLPSESTVIENQDESMENSTGNSKQLARAIEDCIEQQPRIDWRTSARIDLLTAPESAHDAVALTRDYINCGGDKETLFDTFGRLVARDDFTELHGIKQHQVLVDEFNATRESLRDVHLLAAAKSAACIRAGKEQTVYEALKSHLH